MTLSQKQIELASSEIVRKYVEDLRQFINHSELPERRGFIKSFVKAIKVVGNDGLIKYTFPIPPDNHEEEGLGVLPIVHYGGPTGPIAQLKIKTFFELTVGTRND